MEYECIYLKYKRAGSLDARSYMYNCQFKLKRMIHLKKLSVGTESVETLYEWQQSQRMLYHGEEVIARTTRNTPKQAKELLNGGSIYWVINRRIQCRQNIIGIEQDVDETGRKYCILMLDTEMMRTQALSHKPFQGWRYLASSDAPKDIAPVQIGASEEDPPPEDMAQELRVLGLIH